MPTLRVRWTYTFLCYVDVRSSTCDRVDGKDVCVERLQTSHDLVGDVRVHGNHLPALASELLRKECT